MVTSTRIFSSYSVDDLDKALAFYRDTLGLDARNGPMGLELHVTGGAPVFVYHKGADHVPANFTVLNLVVPDLDATVAELGAAGIAMERYDGFGQDDQGVVRSTDPTQGPAAMAWFTDPARNVIGVIQE